MSFKLRYQRGPAHTIVRVFSSEFGPETTHGLNGSLAFRNNEWEAFTGTGPVVAFIDDDAVEPASTPEGA